MKWLILISSLFLFFSCGVQNQQSAKLVIKFDKSAKERLQLMSNEKEFALPDPTSGTELTCFGIFVDYPESNAGNFCTIDPLTPYKVVRPDVVGGLVPIGGGELSLDVLAGFNRTIQVVAFKTAYGGVYPADFCPSVLVDFDPYEEYMSDPFVIAELSGYTISAGEQNLTIDARYLTGTNNNTKLDDCIGPFFQSTAITNGSINVNLYITGAYSIIADGTSTTTITASVTDAYGNPGVDKSVYFNVPTNGGYAPTMLNTDANGIAVFTLTSSTVAGTYSYTVSVDGMTSAAETVTFVPGLAANVSLYLTGTNSLVADGVSSTTFTASVTDVNGNLVVNEPVYLNIPANGGAAPTSLNTDINGQAVFTLTSSTVAGTYYYSATANSITSTPQQALTFYPGMVAIVELTLAGTNPIPADGVSTTYFHVLVKDAYTNPVANKTVTLNILELIDGGSTPGVQITDAFGVANFTLTSSATVGLYNYTATCEAITSANIQVEFN